MSYVIQLDSSSGSSNNSSGKAACNGKQTQQLDLHRFNKLAIYRLMFLSLNIMSCLLLSLLLSPSL